MRLGTAIECLVDNYKYASDKEWINDKVAWALYHTWKEADRKTEPMTTNLEWLKTLSAEELADWFYDEWLHHLQYRWSSSRGGLIIWLKDRKTENSSEIPNNCKPQTIRCPKCGRTDYIRDMEKDMGIKGSDYKYKCINCNTYIKDDPQTERSE